MSKIPPGPPSRFFGLNQLPLFRSDRVMQTFEMCAATYGDVVRVNLAGIRQTMVFHPDYVRQVLIDEPEKAIRSKLQQSLLALFHGNSLTNSEGVFWKRQRKLMQPAFHTRQIQKYVETMVERTARSLQKWQAGATYDIAGEMLNLSRSIVAETLFGTDITKTEDRITEAVQITQIYAERKAPAMLPLPIWVPLPYHRQTQRAIAEIRSLVTGFIQQRRASGEDRGDLLSMLLLATDEDGEHGGGQMTDSQVLDEAMSMLIVGHVTTASALSWVFSKIGQYPEVQAKLVAELDTVLAGRAPTMQDIRQLKYLDMVIKETMRLHPPSWVLPKDVIEDIEIGEFLIPKGTGIFFSQHVMQRDARWFPEPHRFLPERFAEGWESRVPKCAYMPFGVGAHNCIGQIFSITEMHVILAMALQRYRMILEPGQEIVPGNLMNQHPRHGVKMRVELRHPVPVSV